MADQNASRPCGLTIKLEKDILWAPHSGSDYILGYFDKISFLQVYGWLDFSPRATAARAAMEARGGGPVDKRHNPLSTYPLKLLFPSQETMDALKGWGFDYQFWMGRLPDSLDRCPSVTVMLVNLTDSFKDSVGKDVCGEQLAALAQVLHSGTFIRDGKTEPAPVGPEEFQNAHLCILPSLGYSDYCVLMAEEDWDLAPMLIEYLHRAVYEGKPVLSTDYVMPAYHIASRLRDREPAIYSKSHSKGVRLSLRVHLRPGVSMGELKQAAERAAEGKIDVWQLSGSSDCLLESKAGEDFSELLRMVMADCPDHGSRSIKNLVITTESVLQRPVPCGGQGSGGVREPESNPENSHIAALREGLEQYWQLLEAGKRHMRLFNAAWERATLIENICSQFHNRVLRDIMDQWLDAFTDCMSRELQEIEACRARLKQLEEKEAEGREQREQEEREDLEDKANRLWGGLEDALEVFISQAGSFLADLSRSDCFSMESERYNHASVGSATALLLAYNQWQNQFVRDVLEEEGNTSSKYAFLVRSGGCDSTNTNNVFTGLVPELGKASDDARQDLLENMPMITQMSEMSLFDCGGSVLRMVHECMHFCGNRCRARRTEMIFDFASRLFGKILSIALFSGIDYPDNLLRRLETTFQVQSEAITEAVWASWGSRIGRFKKEISGEIFKELKEDLEAEQKLRKWDELDHMSESLREWMREKLSLRFRWYNKSREEASGKSCYPDSKLATTLYDRQLRAVRDFYKDCDEILRGGGETGPLGFCAVERRLLDKRIEHITRDKEYRDWNLKQSIMVVLSRFTMDPFCCAREDELLEALSGYRMPVVLKEVVFSCFSEAFADIQACMRLDVSLEDYLLAFTFEEWNIEAALPKTDSYIYRIGAVLRTCFATSLTEEKTALEKEACERIQTSIENLKRHQLPVERIEAAPLLERINYFLECYQEDAWEMEPLEEYLRLCQKEYCKQGDHAQMRKYQRAFQKIRLLDKANDPDKITEIFTNLVTIEGVSKDGADV